MSAVLVLVFLSGFFAGLATSLLPRRLSLSNRARRHELNWIRMVGKSQTIATSYITRLTPPDRDPARSETARGADSPAGVVNQIGATR
jgi:hypothetical protein